MFQPISMNSYCNSNFNIFIQDSCQKGWRLFSIIAAYFTCSVLLKPYLFKYLESSAYDKRRAYHGTALVKNILKLQNLGKSNGWS
jgi:myosin-15